MKKLVLVLVILAFGTAVHAELLSNAGFESGLTGWTGAGAVMQSSYNYAASTQTVVTNALLARSGTNYLQVGNYASWGSWGYSMAYQDVTVTGAVGKTYNLSAYFMDDWGGAGTQGAVSSILKLEFWGTGGKLLTTIVGPTSISKDWNLGWQLLSLSGIAPAKTGKIRAVVGQGSTLDEQLRIDDVSLVQVVPEPITLALLGFGGLFLRRRK